MACCHKGGLYMQNMKKITLKFYDDMDFTLHFSGTLVREICIHDAWT